MSLRSGLKNRGGLTLAEVTVASLLAVVLGLLAVQLIASGLGAHRRGTEARSAQAGVRQLLSLLVSELRSASIPPLTSPVPLSPIFWPDTWGPDQANGSVGAHYPRSIVGSEDSGEEWDQSENKVVYVRGLAAPPEDSFSALSQSVLVVLSVPEERPGSLERRVFRLDQHPNLLVRRQVEGADGRTITAWQLEVSALDTLSQSEPGETIFDAGADTQVAFQVSHREFEPSSDPGRTRFPERFDPGLFRVQVGLALTARQREAALEPWPEKAAWQTHRVEETDVRLPSVRANL